MRHSLALLLLLVCTAPAAHGQTVEFALAAPFGAATGARAEIAFGEVPSGAGTIGLRLAVGQQLQLGLRLRQADSLATVGNIVTVLAADLSSGGRYTAALTSRAVAGPVAVRLRASASDGLLPFAEVAEGSFEPLPLVTRHGPELLLGLETGASYRLSRALVLDVAPGVFLRNGRLGGRLSGEARFVRAHGPDDLSILLHAYSEPETNLVAGSLGVGYTVNRRRAPQWSLAALLGWGPAGLAPGARIAGAERLANGQLELALAVEPYRVDAWRYRVETGYRLDIRRDEQFRFTFTAGLDPASHWHAGARMSYRLPIAP